MIVIPDYLIIDEILRRDEERKRGHVNADLPMPSYDVPCESNYTRENPTLQRRQPNAPRRVNGAIDIDMNGGSQDIKI